MAIIIPKSKIMKYNFNILQDNHINKISCDFNNTYNLEDIEITFDVENNWNITSYSSFLGGVEKTVVPVDSIFVEYQEYQSDGIHTYYKDFYRVNLHIYIPKDKFYVDDVTKIVDSVILTVTYDDNKIEEKEAQISFRTSSNKKPATLSSNDLGDLFVYTTLSDYNNDYKDWTIICNLLGSIDFGVNQGAIYKAVTSFKINIKANSYKENIKYEYTNETSDFSNFELSSTDMFDKQVGTISGGNRITTPIYELISQNIVDNYNNGKMTMEIETRYTTFEDDEGNEINNGDPYLIKVGDIVKPKMLDKFSAFEYEYVVTSVEYEYDGSDKVYLKLLQVNEE